MRIACIHLPSFPLQVYLRGAPHRAAIGAPVAVYQMSAGQMSAGSAGPTVVACSRAAWGLGVRTGMSVAAARAIAADLIVVPADPAAERAAARAVAESLLAVAEQVEIGAAGGAHHAVYAAVPGRCRGATFGARAREVLAAIGLRGRVGIADDRFTAWVAASAPAGQTGDDEAVVSVPRGGSAAFLAPMPLSLLSIPAEVRHVLEVVGVRTLGEFAALPPPSVSRPWDADLQALARGDGGACLAAFVPAGPVVERVELDGGVGLGAAIGLVAGRVAARLAGRGRAAAELRLRLAMALGRRELAVSLPAALTSADDLADAVTVAFTRVALRSAEPGASLEVEVHAEALADGQADSAVVMAPIAEGEGSAPVAAGDGFQLEAPVVSAVPREPHRRTRRGKHRPRAVPGAQSRLFAGLES